MKIYTYSEARQHFAEVLDMARREEVIIRRKNGETFSINTHRSKDSPFDVPGITTSATTDDIVKSVKETRRMGGRQRKV